MVFVDNKVALRQLELANSALLSRSSLRAADGESLAKDGKFHPRILTLVRDCSPAATDSLIMALRRAVTTPLLFRCLGVWQRCMGQSGRSDCGPRGRKPSEVSAA